MYLELHEKTEIDFYGNQEKVLCEMFHNNNIKIFARHVETMWMSRREILYKRDKEEQEDNNDTDVKNE